MCRQRDEFLRLAARVKTVVCCSDSENARLDEMAGQQDGAAEGISRVSQVSYSCE